MSSSEKKLLGIRILVVDDEPDLRELLVSEFEYHGAKTFASDNGTAAFRFLLENEVDVVVSDVRMPGGDGIKLADQVQTAKLAKRPAIIFVTGFADIALDSARKKGVAEILSKPIDWDLLVATIEKLGKKT